MKDVKNRFLDTYSYLKKEGKVKDQRHLAQILDVSPSLITDIKNDRTNIGLKLIRNIVLRFPEINAEWLLTGKGEMLKSSDKPEQKNNINNISTVLKDRITDLQDQIKNLNKTISILQDQLQDTKQLYSQHIADLQTTVKLLQRQLDICQNQLIHSKKKNA